MRDSIKTSVKTGVAVLTVTGLTMTGIAVAQTGDDPADPGTDEATEQQLGLRGRFGRGHHRGPGPVGTVAELTGLSAQEVIEQVSQAGTSIADVAVANGSSGDEVIATMIANLEEKLAQGVADERLTQEEADEKLAGAEERITEAVNDPDAELRRGGRRGPGRGIDAEAVAEVLGVTTDELRQAKQNGVSLADLAEQQGVPIDDVVAVLVAPLAERLDQAVADGNLTQEEADEKLAELEERIESGEGPGRRGFGPGRGFRPDGPGPGAEAAIDG